MRTYTHTYNTTTMIHGCATAYTSPYAYFIIILIYLSKCFACTRFLDSPPCLISWVVQSFCFVFCFISSFLFSFFITFFAFCSALRAVHNRYTYILGMICMYMKAMCCISYLMYSHFSLVLQLNAVCLSTESFYRHPLICLHLFHEIKLNKYVHVYGCTTHSCVCLCA